MYYLSTLLILTLSTLTSLQGVEAFTAKEASFAQLGYQLTAPSREYTVSTTLQTSSLEFSNLASTACTSSLSTQSLLLSASSSKPSLLTTKNYIEAMKKVGEVCDFANKSISGAKDSKTAAGTGDVVGAQKGNKEAAKWSLKAQQGEKEVKSYFESL